MHKIQKVIKVGDTVYSPAGEPIEITRICSTGFFAKKNIILTMNTG